MRSHDDHDVRQSPLSGAVPQADGADAGGPPRPGGELPAEGLDAVSGGGFWDWLLGRESDGGSTPFGGGGGFGGGGAGGTW
jgi:hypothetical protein